MTTASTAAMTATLMILVIMPVPPCVRTPAAPGALRRTSRLRSPRRWLPRSGLRARRGRVKQRRQRRIPGRQRPAGLEPQQVVEGGRGQLDPGAVREVGVDGRAPGGQRQPVGRLLVPLHLLHGQPAVAGGEDGAAEKQEQRYLTGFQA